MNRSLSKSDTAFLLAVVFLPTAVGEGFGAPGRSLHDVPQQEHGVQGAAPSDADQHHLQTAGASPVRVPAGGSPIFAWRDGAAVRVRASGGGAAHPSADPQPAGPTARVAGGS